MTWLRVCRDDELPPRRAFTLDTAAGRIAVFRAEDGALFAIEDRCPHRGAALSQGVLYDMHKVACPDHGWTIDLTTGKVEAPECGEVRTFEVTAVDGEVLVALPGPPERGSLPDS